MQVKNNLRDVRFGFKMNQKDFAAFLNVGKNLYNRWENQKGQPNLNYALIIARKTNRTVESIFYLES
jgi:putative transcriptional regulator